MRYPPIADAHSLIQYALHIKSPKVRFTYFRRVFSFRFLSFLHHIANEFKKFIAQWFLFFQQIQCTILFQQMYCTILLKSCVIYCS